MKQTCFVIGIQFSVAINLISAAPNDPQGKCVASYAPKADYPALPNGKRPEGEGIYVCHIDVRTGLVKSVSILKSTGHRILDKAAVDSCKRWRFEPGTCAPDVKIRIGFWHNLPPIDKAATN